MARCANCNKIILFGGTRDGAHQFCNATCYNNARTAAVAQILPQDDVEALLNQLHTGPCPLCKGPGPVDVHMAYTVYSMLVLTQRRQSGRICCRSCGVKHQTKAIALSALFGWWGFPWGLIYTPVQISRTVGEITSAKHRTGPSEILRQHVRQVMAQSVSGQIRLSTNCPKCGYDIRVQLESGSPRCPECGTEIERAPGVVPA